MEIKEQIANLEETFILKNKVLQILVNGLYKKQVMIIFYVDLILWIWT